MIEKRIDHREKKRKVQVGQSLQSIFFWINYKVVRSFFSWNFHINISKKDLLGNPNLCTFIGLAIQYFIKIHLFLAYILGARPLFFHVKNSFLLLQLSKPMCVWHTAIKHIFWILMLHSWPKNHNLIIQLIKDHFICVRIFHQEHLAIKLDYKLRACVFHALRFYHMHPYMIENMPENVHIFLFLLWPARKVMIDS